jgi:hypothetical protein
MLNRVNNFKQVGSEFIAASGPKRAHIISRIMTGTLSMNIVFKGMIVSRPMMRNFRDFGTINEPVKFKNLHVDKPEVHPSFEPITSKDLRNMRSEYDCLFVFREDRKLVIALSDLKKEVKRNGRYSPLLHHHDIADGQLVYVAGHVFISKGRVDWITQTSGHFQPFGDHLKKLVEHVFIQNGFASAKGKYKPFFEQDRAGSRAIVIQSKTHIRSLSSSEKIASAVHAISKAKPEKQVEAEDFNKPQSRLLTPFYHKNKQPAAVSKFFAIPLRSDGIRPNI